MRESLRSDLQAQRADWGTRFQRDDELDFRGERLNPKRVELSEADHEALRSIVDRFAPQIDALVQQSFDLTAEAEEATWDEGLPRAYPLIEFEEPTAGPTAGQLVLFRKWVRFP
jgi:hypothetical protein